MHAIIVSRYTFERTSNPYFIQNALASPDLSDPMDCGTISLWKMVVGHDLAFKPADSSGSTPVPRRKQIVPGKFALRLFLPHLETWRNKSSTLLPGE
jgi:hypothetical protein